ncbi:MAG TPA: diguanylate cyclase [Gemmatimonadaceae bacterium]|nr:diguanylate cyclase [Gemmatimonadaceae bacterium]
MSSTTAIQFAPDDFALPEAIRAWLNAQALRPLVLRTGDELMGVARRGRPRLAVFDARANGSETLASLRRLKRDSFTGIVPSVALTAPDLPAIERAFEAGADEVLPTGMDEREMVVRLEVLLRRSDRDTTVHPSTRLPGAVAIEMEISRLLANDARFAVCYADLDHFKEFNDRYSYHEGDRVIRILARILHDVVTGVCPEDSFVGHIGGDDFIFIVPMRAVTEACGEIVAIFDALAPYQYSEQDRRAGYFFGKDRRGQLHRVPLMTLSIGVVTNERRHFTHAAQVSELATEMKSYAKTLPGSVFTVDRRHDQLAEEPSAAPLNPLGIGESR